MTKKRNPSTLILALFALVPSFDAAALGFGRAPQSAVLGQPLDFAVELRLDAGETVQNECVSAEVTLGDVRVPPSQVRARVETRGADAASVRVNTLAIVDEPVVAITLAAGCGSQVSRRFVLLADPPAPVAAPATPMMLAVADTNAAPSPFSAPVAAPQASQQLPAGAVTPSAAPASGARPAAAERRPAPRPPRPPKPATASAKPAGASAAVKATAAAAVPAGPRLKLDVVETRPASPVPAADAAIDEAMTAVAAAASAARSAAEAASASAQRIAALEQSVQTLRAQAQASEREAALWRVKAAQASSLPGWLIPLLVVLGVLAGLAAWLAWRLRAMQAQQQRAWLRAAAAEAAPAKATAPIPLVTSELDFPPSIPAPQAPARPAWPAPVAVPVLGTPVAPRPAPPPTPAPPAVVDLPLEPLVERTEVLPPYASNDDGAPRDVSIDELLDLEQQADFFVVLGQDDSAIELLVDHLRSTGGGSPLPYLKLLEIYRRLDDHEAYERTRSRFNDRFNAYAPEWASDLQAGRTLDDYSGVLPRLQQVWPRPLDAMAELEALLFRKSRGDLFELPAYREVLFLYSLARDLLEREPPEAGHVDLLLPLADGSEFGSTSPSPLSTLGAGDFDDNDGARPTAPIDLDIDLGPAVTRPAGLFDKGGPR